VSAEPVCRVGDGSSHGGTILGPCSPTLNADGIAAARNGDLHSCPLPGHGITALSGSAILTADGKKCVRVTDVAGCGAAMIQGSPVLTSE
jgi:uncharacterized Zn-binding protein involved in type VI secretion